MPDLSIATYDFTRGLKLKNLEVGKMEAEVVLKDAPAALLDAFKKDKMIMQRLGEAAIASLETAKATFHAGAQDIDAGLSRNPPADQADLKRQVDTLNTVSRQILEAQQGAASKAAMAEWDKHVRKNKDLKVFRVTFAVKTTLNAIAIGASIASAVLSLGVLAVTIVGAVKSLAVIVNDVITYCRDMAKTETAIIDCDRAAAGVWTDSSKTANKVGRELATALGVPFVKSLGTLQKLLVEYNAKNAMKDKVADGAWTKAKKLMAEIEKAEAGVANKLKKGLEQVGAQVTELLEKISEISRVSKENELFHSVYTDRFKTYREMQGAGLGRAAQATQLAALAAGLAVTLRTLVQVGTALA